MIIKMICYLMILTGTFSHILQTMRAPQSLFGSEPLLLGLQVQVI